MNPNVSPSKAAQVLIAAVVVAVVAVVVPAFDDGNFNGDVLRAAEYAGAAAFFRTLVLLIPPAWLSRRA